MKFAATALLLGCAAAATAVALQPESFDSAPHPHRQPEIRRAMSFVWQPLYRVFDHASDAGQTAIDQVPQAQPKPVLAKAEALRLIDAAAVKHNLAPAFVKSIVAVESNFDANAVSPKGAIGLMQLMPETAQQYGADPTIPEQNLEAGTHYLRELMDRYQRSRSSLVRTIAAYNAGPAMVDRYRGIPPFRETRQYVSRVLGFLRRFRHGDFNG